MPPAVPIIAAGALAFGGSLATGALLSTAIIVGLTSPALETCIDGKVK